MRSPWKLAFALIFGAVCFAACGDEAPDAGDTATATKQDGNSGGGGRAASTADASSKARADKLVREAEIFLRRLDYAEAIAKFDEAFALDASNTKARLGRELEPVSRTDGEQAAKLTDQGIHLARFGNFLQAGEMFKQANDLDPNNEKALRNYANCLLETRRYTEARTLFQRTIDRYPNNPEPRMNAAVTAYRQRDYEGCLEYVRSMTPLISKMEEDPRYKPQIETMWFTRGMAANYLHLIPEAIDSLQRVVRINPNNPSYQHFLGGVYLEDGQFDLALRALNKSRELDPNFPRNYYFIARAHDKKGEKLEAINWYKKAIRLDKTNFLAYVNIARCFEALQTKSNLMRAVSYLDQALEINNLSHEAYFTMSRVWKKLNDPDQAKKYRENYDRVNDIAKTQEEKLRGLTKRIQANPLDSEARLAALEIHRSYAHWSDALDEARDLLRHDPKNVEGLFHISNLLMVEKNFQDAYFEALKMIEVAPQDSRAYTLAGYACLEMAGIMRSRKQEQPAQKMIAQAVDWCRKAMERNEHDYGAIELLLRIYQQMPDKQAEIERLTPIYEKLRDNERKKAIEREKERRKLLGPLADPPK